jgi:nucleotide-binding universal stress UspA family protein
VRELPHYPTLFEGTALVVPPIDESLRAQLEQQLQKLAAETAADGGFTCRAVLREGPPTQELLDCAKEVGADLLIIATHGYTGLKHMLLGSTAEQVVRHASCPVLTIRAELSKDS